MNAILFGKNPLYKYGDNSGEFFMPGSNDVKVNFSTFTYQSFDGKNFTTAGYNCGFNGGVGIYAGLGSDFEGQITGVIDLKESNKYSKNSVFEHNIRIRTKLEDKLKSTQVRVSPCSADIPLDRRTSLYVNPHYAANYNYDTKKWKHSAGIFVGVSYKCSDRVNLSAELQRYNLQNISDNHGCNYSANVGFSVKL